MTDAFVLGGVRTPVGRYGGSLSHIRTDDLLGQTMARACERVGVPLERIEDIAAGCVNPAHEGMGDIARWAALAAGFPDSVPAITVNRFCASSLSGAISIAHAIRSDELSVGLAARGRVDVALGLGVHEGRRAVHAARAGAPARHDVGRRRRPAEPRPAGPRRVHRHDADGPERRRPLRADPRGDRRVRPPLAPARGRGPRLRAAGQGDPSRSRSRPPARPRRGRSSTTSRSATTRRPRSSPRFPRSRTRPR